MASEYVVWGAKGSGSVPVEAALTLIGAPYELRDLANWYDVQTDAEAGRLNPQRQLPALVLASGEVITESAAILLYLAEAHPQARLAPPADAPERAQFLRWMIYVPAHIYSMCWARRAEPAGRRAGGRGGDQGADPRARRRLLAHDGRAGRALSVDRGRADERAGYLRDRDLALDHRSQALL